jgi:type I restriction enzyme S subunit
MKIRKDKVSNWKIENIGKFATIGRGSSPRPITDKRFFENGTIPWIKIADATAAGRIIYKTKEYVNEYGASFSRLLKKGSLILSASGVSLGIPRFLGVDGCIHDGWLYLENIHDIDVDFLYYRLLTLRTYFDNLSYGAAIQNINTDIFSKTKISLPPLPTQQKIASILSAYDNLIQNYKKQIEALQTAASELYKEWSVRFRFPGWQNAKFENGIPEGWKVVLASELGEFIRGKNITAEEMQKGTIPVISAGIEPSGFHNQSNVKGVSLTISNSGANAGYLQINYSNIWAADCSYCNSAKHIYFYYELLNNMRVVLFNLQKGAAQPHVYAKDINKMKILLPPSDLIETADNKIKLMHEKIYSLQQQITNLTQQRDLLLPRLMSGKMEI